MTKVQNDIPEKKDAYNVVSDWNGMPKVKCKADCKNNWQSQLNMQAVLQVICETPKILLARGYRLNKIPRSVRLIWRAEK